MCRINHLFFTCTTRFKIKLYFYVNTTQKLKQLRLSKASCIILRILGSKVDGRREGYVGLNRKDRKYLDIHNWSLNTTKGTGIGCPPLQHIDIDWQSLYGSNALFYFQYYLRVLQNHFDVIKVYFLQSFIFVFCKESIHLSIVPTYRPFHLAS